MPHEYEQLRDQAGKHGQEHLFHYWEGLDADQRALLLSDIARIDFATVDRLTARSDSAIPIDRDAINPPPVFPAEPDASLRQRYDAAMTRGRDLLTQSKVAVMVVAGGQGTRLGFDAPKGTFPIGPISGKTLFEIFADTILATQRRYGCKLPWYVMTSEATDAATRAYFDKHNHLGLDPKEVMFFQQGVMPAVDADGKILLADKHRVALSPNGHGGSLRALADCGVLDDMARRGTTALSYFQVDNPLVNPANPLFIGLHDLEKSQMSSIAVPKVDDVERVGNFVSVDGKVQVIEYSDLPEELARAKNPDGSRMLNSGSIAIHLICPDFVRNLTSGGELELPWHIANKKVPHLDLNTAELVEPDAPNARKFETFIFDAIPLAQNAMILEQPRLECFSPVKNAEGVDSPKTTKRDISRRALKWLSQAGVDVPAEVDDEPGATVEISARYALDAAELAAKGDDLPRKIAPGERLHLT